MSMWLANNCYRILNGKGCRVNSAKHARRKLPVENQSDIFTSISVLTNSNRSN